MEIFLSAVFVVISGFIIFKAIKSSSKGKCKNCDKCAYKCDKPEDNNK